MKNKDVIVGSAQINSMFPCIFKTRLIKTLINILQIQGAAAAVPPVCVSVYLCVSRHPSLFVCLLDSPLCHSATNGHC